MLWPLSHTFTLKATAAAALTQDVQYKVHALLECVHPQLVGNPGSALVTFTPPHVHVTQSLKAAVAFTQRLPLDRDPPWTKTPLPGQRQRPVYTYRLHPRLRHSNIKFTLIDRIGPKTNCQIGTMLNCDGHGDGDGTCKQALLTLPHVHANWHADLKSHSSSVQYKVHALLECVHPQLVEIPGSALVTFTPPHVHVTQSLKAAAAAAAALTQDVH